jgi:hypothetical protein
VHHTYCARNLLSGPDRLTGSSPLLMRGVIHVTVLTIIFMPSVDFTKRRPWLAWLEIKEIAKICDTQPAIKTNQRQETVAQRLRHGFSQAAQLTPHANTGSPTPLDDCATFSFDLRCTATASEISQPRHHEWNEAELNGQIIGAEVPDPVIYPSLAHISHIP